MTPQDYEISIRPLTEAEGEGLGAIVPELPGCIADGETPQEALKNVLRRGRLLDGRLGA